jgi:glycosyltransferase involved in cell wall biosynthesis
MVLNLASALPRDEFEVHVGALVGAGLLISKAAEAGYPAVHFQFKNPVQPRGIMRLIRYCRQNRIDIVQTHGLRADGVARWAARVGGVRAVISTIHSIDPWRRVPHVLLDRATAPFVSLYVAVCEAARQAAIKREKISPGSCAVVPIGVPPREIPREDRDAIRQELGLSHNAYPVVGVLANLRDMKGHRHIIAALPAILEKNPDVKFIFAGRDDSNGAIKAAAEQAGVAHAIHFLGFYQHPDRLFAAMDIFLLPSDWEGFPVSILEAMQAGVPVIATAVGGILEMIHNGVEGLLISPKAPAEIADAVNLLARDFALRATLVKAADAQYQSSYTLEAMSNKMTHLYRQVLKNA